MVDYGVRFFFVEVDEVAVKKKIDDDIQEGKIHDNCLDKTMENVFFVSFS